MDVLNLAELLLSPDEKNELHSSMEPIVNTQC